VLATPLSAVIVAAGLYILYRCLQAIMGKHANKHSTYNNSCIVLDWIVQCFTSLPAQYRLYGRRFLQVKRPNQQYQSTEGDATKDKENNRGQGR